MSTPFLVGDYLERFVADLLRDALNNATAEFWRRRARDIEAAMPRAEDFPGNATPEQRAARALELAAIAQACRHHADLIDGSWIQHLVDAGLRPTCGTPPSPWTCSCGELRVGGAAA